MTLTENPLPFKTRNIGAADSVLLGAAARGSAMSRGLPTVVARRGIIVCAVSGLLVAAGAVIDPRPRAAAQAGEAIRRDTTPPLLSLYLPIPLGVPKLDRQSTGVFLPAGYRAGKSIDLLLFLRGYDIKRPDTATPVAEYWNSPRHPVLKSFLLREEVNRSGKNVVLAVPTLGPFAEAGRLADTGGLREFFDHILDALRQEEPHAKLGQRPVIRHLVLAAHSGGGVPLRRLARILGDDAAYRDKLKACWGFDSIYGVKSRDAEFWADWARDHPGTQVSMFYLFTERLVGKDPSRPPGAGNPLARREPTGTTGPALELQRLAKERMLPNVRVVRETKETTLDHGEVPRAHLAELLKAAPYLDDR